ncbi:MAG: DUF4394 domain-containing protein, partial [Acidobacteria bacterium]|nr:DUF4394 domain-containing protein [Acidobacteriota bacterium]
MKKTTRRATYWLGLALALAVFAGGIVPPGRSQQRAKSAPNAARPQPQQQQNPSKPKPTEDATAQALHPGDDFRVRTLPPELPGKIAFASDRTGNFDIYVMDPDGGGIIRLTDDPAEDVQPTWSPDGTQIAFVSNRDSNKEIYVVNASGGAATRLTNNPAEDISPAWSPSLTTGRIAFVSNRDGNDEVYLMNTDGTNQTNLTQNAADDNGPAWAPSGTLLAFASNRDGDKFEIYRIGADGANPLRLTNNTFDDVAPAWPPGQITFQSDRDGNDEIYTINADGSNPVRITNNPAFDLDPARSSDGARVVWVSSRDAADNLEIYAANADGSNVRRLTNNPASDMDPAIQPLPSAATLGTVQLSAATYTVSEGQRTLDITVTRTGGTGAASVEITTVPGSASERTDYSAIERTLRFAEGETSKMVQLSVIDDLRIEDDETLTISLSGAVNTTIGNPSSAVVTITDNDSAVAATGATLIGVTAEGNLVRFSSATPGTIDATVAITGLQTGETILGIDVRPATRQLYALGSTGRIYIVNQTTGAAQLASTLSVALNGTAFGVDFNPVPDRLRIISDADQNLRVNVADGVATVDGTLAYAAGDANAGQNPNAVGAAYSNNFAGATSTTLYVIDSNRDILATQNPPNNGTLNTVGPLGVDTSDVVGFDITNPGGAAIAVLTVGGVSQLYTINLTSGAATPVGNVGGGSQLRAVTAANLPVNPIDDAGFFVRQQYLDFLSREPDAAGFNAFVDTLENCPNQFNTDPNSPSARCDRISVSASFFLSLEFQIRGSVVIRSYLAAFGRLPTFREFIRDLSTIGGVTDEEATANRSRYPDDFIQRPE